MADIELVIKIPEAEYELIVNDEACGLNTLTRAIAKGTQLPKGHGDLIDKSNLLTITDYDGENEKTYVLYEEIEDAQPIIKADKESEG
ncbi:MAG: hypothetical protein J6Y78_00285 [Paludibacteraceae bacterium]|nr:hypothetical protein [Paludibacteraceae bacterium]